MRLNIHQVLLGVGSLKFNLKIGRLGVIWQVLSLKSIQNVYFLVLLLCFLGKSGNLSLNDGVYFALPKFLLVF